MDPRDASASKNCSACEEGPGLFSHLLTIASVLMIIATLPLSLLMTVKVVQVGHQQHHDLDYDHHRHDHHHQSITNIINIIILCIQEYERAVIFRLGRLLSGGARGPGVFFIIPCVDIYEKIDMRTATYEIPPQEILTKDSVTVFVNAIMYYKVRVFENF